MDNPYADYPLPRWACVLGLVQAVVCAVLLTFTFL